MKNEPDSQAFGALYAQHFRTVWRTVARLGVHPAFVDDATQEVFITAWKRLADFEGRSTHRTWLLGIAVRVAADARRKQRPTEEVSVQLQTDRVGPDASAETRQINHKVERLLQSLDAERREILVLVDLEGYSVPEVAEATGVNLNTLYTRLRTARQQFEALVTPQKEALR